MHMWVTCSGMAFPENLRRVRLGQFLSQAELARRSGVHALTITRLESGRTAPSTRTVLALAAALAITPRELATPEEVAETYRRDRRGERIAALRHWPLSHAPHAASTAQD